MRIAHIITRFVPGGADENTLLTCNHQAQAGDTVFLVSGHDWDPLMRAKLDPKAEFIVVPSLLREVRLLWDTVAVVRMTALFRSLRLDIVHTHTSKAGILGRIAARLAGVPTIVHSVHILPFRNVATRSAWFYVALERFCGSFTDLFIHVSQDTLQECRKMRIGSAARHIVAESGMDVDKFRAAPKPLDDAALCASPLEGGGRPFVLLSLAALDRRKGLHRFLHVFARIVARRPNAVLLLAGVGAERGTLETLAADLRLSRHVRFLGFRDDPERLLAAADALIICSEREGLPRVAVQAGIAGVPIVTTALPGIDLIVRPGVSGVIVPLDDLSPMAEEIGALIDDPEKLKKLRQGLSLIDYQPWQAHDMCHRIDKAYRDVRDRGPVDAEPAVRSI